MKKKPYKIFIAVIMSFLFVTSFIWSQKLTNGILSAKMFYFYGTAALIILSVGILFLFKRTFIIAKLNILDISLLVFITYSFIRLIFTRHVSIDNDFFLWLAILAFIYLIWKQIISFDKNNNINFPGKIFIATFLLSGFLQASYGILQLYNISPGIIGRQYKVIGSLGNPDYFAGYLVSVAPFAFGIYFLSKKRKLFNKLLINLALMTFLTCLFILPSTFSRTSWIALIAGGIFILFHKFEASSKIRLVLNTKFKVISSLLVSILFVVVVIGALYQIKPASAFGRLFIWKITYSIIAEKPLFGIGFNRFEADYNNYQANYFATGNGILEEKLAADNVRHAHNEFLQIWAELGLIGLFIFISIIIIVFLDIRASCFEPPDKESLSEIQIINLSSKASILSILVFSFFSFPLHILPTLINFMFLLSIISTTGNLIFIKKIKIINPYSKSVAVFTIVISLLLTVKILPIYNAFKKWERTYYFTQLGLYEKAEVEYENLYETLEDNGEFLFNYGGILLASGKHRKAIIFLEKSKKRFCDPNIYIALGQCYDILGNYQLAEENYIHSKFIIPHKVYPKYLLANFYKRNNRITEAIRTAEEVLETKIKVKTTAAMEIKKEMKELIKKNKKNSQ